MLYHDLRHFVWAVGVERISQFCIDMWHNEYKAQAFETFLDYFFSVSKGAAVISVASALLSTFIGIILFHSKKETDIFQSSIEKELPA